MRHFFPAATAILAAVQIAGGIAAAFPAVHTALAVAPEVIFRRGELWRLLGGPFVANAFSWPDLSFEVVATVAFGWHLERIQGRQRTMLLFFGGSVFAALLWSIAALVWDWKRPLFTPVGTTALAVGALLPGLRRPFPAFARFSVPVWVAFVGYAALWSWLSYAGVIDLSAHFLAGLFAVLVGQSGQLFRNRRTTTAIFPVSTSPDGAVPTAETKTPESARPSDPEFDRRVDDLLRKITDSGYDSLNEDEIALLLEASQRYRDRPPPSS